MARIENLQVCILVEILTNTQLSHINDFLLGIVARRQFSNKASGWGWKKFISLEDFKDASKGYLIKGKCCIEAEVAIVGSSKTE